MTKHGLMEETLKTLMEVTGGTFDLYITILDSVEVLLNFLFIKESGGGGDVWNFPQKTLTKTIAFNINNSKK